MASGFGMRLFLSLAAVGLGESCASSDGSCELAELGMETVAADDEAVGLLQLQASRASVEVRGSLPFHFVNTNDINVSRAWAEITAAVKIDQLQAAIQNATDSEFAQHLKEQLKDLRQQFPSSEEVQERFSDQWENITEAIDVESLETRLREALAAGSDKVDKLREQLDELRSRMPDDIQESIQNKTAEKWRELQERGVHLPDLDNLSERAQQLARDAFTSVQDAWNSTVGTWNTSTWDSAIESGKDALRDIASSASDKVHQWWDQVHSSGQ